MLLPNGFKDYTDQLVIPLISHSKNAVDPGIVCIQKIQTTCQNIKDLFATRNNCILAQDEEPLERDIGYIIRQAFTLAVMVDLNVERMMDASLCEPKN